MSSNDLDDARTYIVLQNHEEQYSLWLKCNQIPAGWKETGKEGLKSECLEYIKNIWKDTTPYSLRKRNIENMDGNPG
jgi:MbtH protein